jgi:hypothetical protein
MTELQTESELDNEMDELLSRHELAQEKLKTLDDEQKILLSAISTHISTLLADKDFFEFARNRVRRKMSGALVTSEFKEIADDAISHVTESLRITVILKTTEVFSKEKLNGKLPTISEVRKYLINGIEGYCNTRLRRWSVDQKPAKKKNNEDNSYANDAQSKEVKGKIAARARTHISSNSASDSDFWDQHISTSLNDEAPDLSKAAQIIMSKGLSEEQIELVLERISGKKFSDMAREKGGTEDQYRKAFNRALEKIGIDKRLVLGD